MLIFLLVEFLRSSRRKPEITHNSLVVSEPKLADCSTDVTCFMSFVSLVKRTRNNSYVSEKSSVFEIERCSVIVKGLENKRREQRRAR
jgi:hypothetical protein